MKKTVAAVLVGLVWPSLGSSLAYTDEMILPGAPGPDYLVVRYHHVTVSINDGHAVTHVDQEFYNPFGVALTGHYLFPVPPEAMLTRFEAEVDARRQAPVLQDSNTTNTMLYAQVTRQHDPSLLQYTDWESLAFEVSLPPGGSRRMSLEYEQVLERTGGLYRYRYVLGTERYSSQPLEEASIKVSIRSSSGLASVYPCPGPARQRGSLLNHWLQRAASALGIQPATGRR